MENYLLVYPKPTDDSPTLNTPLSILYAGEWLKERGNNVRYTDLRTEELKGLDLEWADTIGFSTMSGKQCKETENLAQFVKALYPYKKTIIGGYHPKSIDVDSPFIDEVWKGNYEPKQFPFNESTQKYFEPPYEIQYFSSDNCWGSCRFCVLKDPWKARPIDEVKSDLENILSKTNQKYVVFGEPNIGANVKRIKQIGEVMTKYDTYWHANIRPDVLTDKMVKALQESNCKSLEIGGESGNEYALRHIIKKNFGPETTINAAKRLAKTDISCMYSFLTNYPQETKDMQNDTVNLIDKIHKIDKNARTSIYSYMPLPGTEMYDESIEKELFTPPETLGGWGEVTMSNDPIYWIAGLKFRKDNTGKNFPGYHRLKILPYEALAHVLWKTRQFNYFPCKTVEKIIKKRLE